MMDIDVYYLFNQRLLHLTLYDLGERIRSDIYNVYIYRNKVK